MSEQQNIEYKQSWHDDYLKWVCGFANAIGGIIYIGKDDGGATVHLDGWAKLLEDIPNKIRNAMGIVCDVQLQDDDRKKFISIKVNPYNVPVSLRGRYYYRSGSVKLELTGVELNEFLLKRAGKTWDDVVEEGASINDIDEKSIEKFIADSSEKGRMPETNGLSSFQILEKLQLTEGENLKRAAVILFGKDPGRFYPNMEIKIGRFGKDSTDLRFQEIVEGNLIQMLEQVQVQLNYKFLTRPVDFEGLRRIEKNEYPLDALREMLLNALVHRTYMGAPIQIRVFDERLSIWNEGGLPLGLSVEDLKAEHNSRPRNPKIAKACFMAGYIDTWGRGTLKIINSCRDAKLPDPEIAELQGGMLVALLKNSNQAGNQVSIQVGNQGSLKLETKVNKNWIALLEDVLINLQFKPSEKAIAKYLTEAETVNENQIKVLAYCQIPKKRKDILEDGLKISNQTKNFNANILPLLEKGLLQLTIKDRPQSPLQKYLITNKGKIILYIHEHKQE